MELAQIKTAIVSQIKQVKDIDVFFEEISRMSDTKKEDYIKECFYVELIAPENTTCDKTYTEVSIPIDIMYLTQEPITNGELLLIGAKLDEQFRPIFKFGDRKISIPSTSTNIVDGVLHFKFKISFRSGKEEKESYPLMETLEIRKE